MPRIARRADVVANMKLDPAIVKLLDLDPDQTSITAAAGGGCSSASTFKITTKLGNGTHQNYFMKTGTGDDAKTMFEGEHASLNALHNAVPSLCPASFGHGRCSTIPSTHFLVTEFLHLSARYSRSSSPSLAPSLAAKMAKLHTTPAPIPRGYDKPMFGFSHTTCCGDTPQTNAYKASWADFYAENRLRFILSRGEKRHGMDTDLHAMVTNVAGRVVPRLLGDDHLGHGKGIMPVVVHGDLWSGNASKATIGGAKGEPEDVVYDPSACYAHSEYDLGIMRMFGGFGREFFDEYHKLCPKTAPVEEYEDRVKLYELYHHLNHYALFGGGYKSGAMSIMKNLWRKYGDDKL